MLRRLDGCDLPCDNVHTGLSCQSVSEKTDGNHKEKAGPSCLDMSDCQCCSCNLAQDPHAASTTFVLDALLKLGSGCWSFLESRGDHGRGDTMRNPEDYSPYY